MSKPFIIEPTAGGKNRPPMAKTVAADRFLVETAPANSNPGKSSKIAPAS
jgi:hypothetical protein